jgi:hypothetical protein
VPLLYHSKVDLSRGFYKKKPPEGGFLSNLNRGLDVGIAFQFCLASEHCLFALKGFHVQASAREESVPRGKNVSFHNCYLLFFCTLIIAQLKAFVKHFF